ncbi:hypothetical protein C1Y40_05728 [Mycobacterium talmoniae]|uniref:Uncharacterized protein n=1 Tax=Mycobacterium talmoniae TaxID=1858794 RepID=A0A2S8BBT6_9MYCO|nr:hypothetical protein C1Y40_05728 [Mycobacterium talmoniae]
MLASVASSTTAAQCNTPRTGRPDAVAAATIRSAVPGSAISPHSTSIWVPRWRIRSIACCAWPLGDERPLRMMRPQPAAAIFSARNKPKPPRPPVMTYAPSPRNTAA